MTGAATEHKPSMWRALWTRHMAICVLIGFASGLPLYLLLNLVPAWLRSSGINLKTIGLFALIQFPYTWKFIWAPLLDRYGLNFLKMGRRRGWMLVTQLGLVGAIGVLGGFDPQRDISTIMLIAALVAVFSATQDIALDAFRRELLSDEELGLGNSVLPGVFCTFWVKEPVGDDLAPRTLKQAVVEPFNEFMARAGWKSALTVLAFIFCYKLGDSLCTALATPFYLDMGYAKSDIGLVAKNAGLWPAVIGGLLGGLWMVKLGINRALWLFGVVQVVSIFGFAWLAGIGPQTEIGATQLWSLALVIGFEALGVGLGTAAFVAFIARSTNRAYTATQFALFTSLAAVPRTLINASAGWLVEQLGWYGFFWLCVFLAIPGMLLLFKVAPWFGDDRSNGSEVPA